MIYDIENLKNTLDSALKQVKTLDDLEQVRVAFIGRNGSAAALMHTLKALSIEDKKVYGPLCNELKQYCFDQVAQTEEYLKKAATTAHDQANRCFDITAYRQQQGMGSLHVYSHFIELLENIFISMGYDIVDGPEVETNYYNFEALNIPEHHPARDMQDTFWLDVPGMLLRTHTSPVQIHAMQKRKPPLAIFAPGRVYRNESSDASHDFLFMQGECLFIDKQVSIANLMATAQAFLRAFFGDDAIQLRVRPGYFPFVEPGLEIDASCPFCTNGCSICKHTRWIELLGAGLVHPHVLKAGGIDPEEYSGFAFGFGFERLAMIKYGINDVRLFKSNKLSFLSQF